MRGGIWYTMDFTEILTDSVMDTLKMLPILFAVYLLLEYLEHKATATVVFRFSRGRFAPFFGAIGGLIPQCGVSAAAAGLFTRGAITAGTLIAVFLATSDEALPILLSASCNVGIVAVILLGKLVVGTIAGILIDFLWRQKVVMTETPAETEAVTAPLRLTAIAKEALTRTIHIGLYVLAIISVINITVSAIGEERLSSILMAGNPFLPFITGLVGLVPSCAVSVLLTELLVAGQIPLGAAFSGLCTGTGFGLLILFKQTDIKRSVTILTLTYLSGSVAGLLIGLVV